MGRTLVIVMALLLLGTAGQARGDGGGPALMGADLFAEAERRFDEATTFADQKDFVAAAIVFGQVEQLCAGLERGPGGEIVDAEAHQLRHDAINNQGASYSRARMPVEAAAAFLQLRELFGAELGPEEVAALDRKIELLLAQIGTVTVSGLPADLPTDARLEIRIDGKRRALVSGEPYRIEEGTHSVEIRAPGYQPFLAEIAVLAGTDVALPVTLAPLTTPARVRIEATVSGAAVKLDGRDVGAAPIEVSVDPGKHQVEVSSESYLEQSVDFEVAPGERAILRVALGKRRAPLGVRIAPYFIATVPLRGDTPFGTWTGGGGLHVFHQALTWRNVRFGLAAEYHGRQLNQLAMGAVATVCPDALSWMEGRLGICPLQFALHKVFGDDTEDFSSGWQDGRLATAFEWRTGPTVIRVAGGVGVETYRRADGNSLFLWTSSVELSLGLDL